MGRIKFTDYVPQNLIGVNSASKTLSAEVVTGTPIATGAVPGESFFISAKQATQLSTVYFPVYEGWYRVVQIDTGATAANVQFGSIGGQVTLAKGDNVVTDQANVLKPGIAPVVFLAGGCGLLVSGAFVPDLPLVTPGYYTIVQDAGDASVLLAANQAVSVGDVLVGAAGVGTVTKPAATVLEVVNTLPTIVGVAEAAVTTPAALTGASVVAASGGVAAYHGTYTGGDSNAFAGMQAVITGAQYSVNDSPAGQPFLITASSATVLTLANPNAIAETHAHTATLQALVRVRLGFSFGQQI